MIEPKFTRCPGCATVFRVTREQLVLREGQVRCGNCRAVFDAHSHVVEVGGAAPSVSTKAPTEDRAAPIDDAEDRDALIDDVEGARVGAAMAPEPGPPTEPVAPVDLKEPTEPVAPVEPQEMTEPVAPIEPTESMGPVAADPPAPALDPAELEAARAAHRRRTKRARSGNAFYVFAIAFLVAGLAAQALLQFHDVLAVRVPSLAPALAYGCRWLACTIGPPRNASALSIEGSDLQADPAHRGLLILAATIRNRSPWAVAFPYFELTLTDANDQVVVRRAFAPSEYLDAGVRRDAGLAGNHEQSLRLLIDASSTTQAGYRVYLFYP